MLALGLGLLCAGPSRAAPPPAQEAEARIDAALAQRAEGQFEACGNELLEIYNAFESYPEADELLYMAADCHAQAGMVGSALMINRALVERYPESGWAPEALWRLAEIYGSVTYFEQAAERYEQYASTYAKDAQSPQALHNAYLLRLGLDQRERARDNLDRYAKLYAKSDSRAAAEVFWSRFDLAEDEEQRRQTALDYIATHGDAGGYDRELLAEFIVAQIDWRRSCREPLLLETCVSVERGSKPPPPPPGLSPEQLVAVERARGGSPPAYRRPDRCDASQPRFVVHARKAKLADAAQARFKRLLKEGRRWSGREKLDPERSAALNSALAHATLYQLDPQLEDYLRQELPSKLDFRLEPDLKDSGVPSKEKRYKEQIERRQDSQKRLANAIGDRLQQAQRLEVHYAKLKSFGDMQVVVLGAQRFAWLAHGLAAQLRGAAVPRGLRERESVRAYCEALTEFAEPVRERAVAAYEYCLYRAHESNELTAAARVCAQELESLEPGAHPPTLELYGEAGAAVLGGGMASVGLIADPASIRVRVQDPE